MNNLQTGRGLWLASLGALLWGGMGIACQYLLQDRGVPGWWLMSVRMLLAGALLLGVDYHRHGRDFFAPWQSGRSCAELLIFTFITLLGVQYAYMQSVYYINAATATVFIGAEPMVLVLWVCLRERRRPSLFELCCCFSVALGVLLMATRGDLTSLAIGKDGLLWGGILMLMGTVYTAQPAYLMQHFRPANVVGWGLLTGGLVTAPWLRPWQVPLDLDLPALLALGYVVVLGTAVAFWSFLSSLQYLKPHIAGVIEMLEPLSAVLLSLAFFDIVFGLPEFAGSVLILAPVAALAVRKEKA